MIPSVLSCAINAGPDGRERVCALSEPTLSPSADLLPVLCQSYCPNSVQHSFLVLDMSGPCLLVNHPILDYNASGLLFIPRYLPFLSLSLLSVILFAISL